MFANAQQGGFISIFYSVGSNPLALWDKQVKNGHIRRVIDDEVKSLVLDIGGTNVATTYITCPIKPRASLGVQLPYLVMVIKNMKKYFSFEIQILDDKDMRRRFRVSNFQSTTKVRPFCTTMPIGLSAGWNQVQFNLADFTKRAYGSMYVEAVRVQIHANVRIRRIYFTDQLHSDEDLPNEFKLFAPGPKDKTKPKEPPKKTSKEALEAAAAAEGVPPLKIERPDEEMPLPPSPAEESPVAQDEEPPSEDEAPKEGVAAEGEGEVAEAPPPEEGTEEKIPEEGEGELPQPSEGELPQPSEGDLPQPTEGEPPGPTESEIVATETTAPQEGEGGEVPAESDLGEPGEPIKEESEKGDVEQATEGEETVQAETTEATTAEETTVEQSETVQGDTTEFTTDVTDTEGPSASEPPTETEGEA